jgi:hypothetical protein
VDIQFILSFLFGGGVLVSFGKYLLNKIKANDEKTDAVCLGVQALLRDRLIQSYNHYNEKGYAPLYAKENFENMWKQYHALGVNGVMDRYHDAFMLLPDFPPEGCE